MSLEQLTALEAMRTLLAGSQALVFVVASGKKAGYQWMQSP